MTAQWPDAFPGLGLLPTGAPVVRHGTRSQYSHGCRCTECAAWAAAHKVNRSRRVRP